MVAPYDITSRMNGHGIKLFKNFSACSSTLTNVNFDAERFQHYIEEAVQRREEIKELYMQACKKNNKPIDEEIFMGPVIWMPERPYSDLQYLENEGKLIINSS